MWFRWIFTFLVAVWIAQLIRAWLKERQGREQASPPPPQTPLPKAQDKQHIATPPKDRLGGEYIDYEEVDK